MEETDQAEQQRHLHAVVHGRVQGVSFRAYTQREAVTLGLTGWVRNLPDGTVETIAEGPRSSLKSFLSFLRTGPSSARVDKVDVSWSNATGEFTSFRIRYF